MKRAGQRVDPSPSKLTPSQQELLQLLQYAVAQVWGIAQAERLLQRGRKGRNPEEVALSEARSMLALLINCHGGVTPEQAAAFMHYAPTSYKMRVLYAAALALRDASLLEKVRAVEAKLGLATVDLTRLPQVKLPVTAPSAVRGRRHDRRLQKIVGAPGEAAPAEEDGEPGTAPPPLSVAAKAERAREALLEQNIIRNLTLLNALMAEFGVRRDHVLKRLPDLSPVEQRVKQLGMLLLELHGSGTRPERASLFHLPERPFKVQADVTALSLADDAELRGRFWQVERGLGLSATRFNPPARATRLAQQQGTVEKFGHLLEVWAQAKILCERDVLAAPLVKAAVTNQVFSAAQLLAVLRGNAQDLAPNAMQMIEVVLNRGLMRKSQPALGMPVPGRTT